MSKIEKEGDPKLIKDEENKEVEIKEEKLEKDPKDTELKSKQKEVTEEEKKKESSIFSAFNLQKFLMEFIGSFAIIYFGNWAQIFSDLGFSNEIAVSITIGLIMTVFTWIGVDVSGAHFNPITTVRNE